MGYHRGRPKLHLHLATGGILILACGVAAYWYSNRDNDVWEAAKAAATKQLQETLASSVQPLYPEHGDISEPDEPTQPGTRAFVVQSWMDVNGSRVQWQALIVKKGDQYEAVGVVIDPEATKRRFQAVADQLAGE